MLKNTALKILPFSRFCKIFIYVIVRFERTLFKGLTEMDTVGIGAIGCGDRLRSLLETVVKKYPWIKIVALSDVSQKSIDTIKNSCAPDAKVFADYHDLVKAPEVKWVFIGSWNCFHKEHAIAALEAGKDVFCEKPLATTFEDCMAMKAALEKSGRIFFIGFTLRYSPVHTKIKKLLTEGAIGKIISMEFNETLAFNHGGYIHRDWRRLTKNAGTHLLEKCCHDIDLVHWMVDSLPVSVASFGGCDFFKPENLYHMDRIGPNPQNGNPAFCDWPCRHHPDPFTGDKDIVDNQVAIIQFANGVRSTFHTNCVAGIPERRMYILGTEGCIRADMCTGIVECQRYGWEDTKQVWNLAGVGGHGGSDEVLCDQIGQTLKEHVQPFSGLTEGLKSAITCFAIDDSMNTGKLVDVRPYWEKAGIEVQ